MSAARNERRSSDTALLVVLGGVAVALLTTAVVGFRPGGYVLAGTLALAAVLRLVLPVHRVGALAVRSRAVDLAVLVALAVGTAVLVGVVPTP
jgi:cation transport ATPase